MPTKNPNIDRLANGFSLVLSGGGALGYAHIGVIDYLAEQNLHPAALAGTSMGAIIAAATAIGLKGDILRQQVQKFSSLTNWARPSLHDTAMIHNNKLTTIFTELFGDLRMSDIDLPVAIIATDFNDGTSHIFTNEDDTLIRDAVLCSMAIPIIFPPVQLQDNWYVDGFLSANLPLKHVPNSIPALAVDVMSAQNMSPYQGNKSSLLQRTGALTEMYERSLLLMIAGQTRQTMEGKDNILYLAPNLADFRLFHFHKHAAIIKAGYLAAENYFS